MAKKNALHSRSGVEKGRVVRRFQEFPKQFGHDCLLAFGWWVCVLEGFEEGLKAWVQVLASREVNETWFEIVAKSCSQTALQQL
jgi:hypothetical protein